EAPVAPEADDHGVPERADLVRGFRGEVAPAGRLADLVDALPEGRIEGLEQRHPRPLAAGYVVEVLLHLGGEGEVDVVPEMLDQQVDDDARDRLGVQPPLL